MKVIRAWIEGLGRRLTKPEINRLRRIWNSVPHVRCKELCADQCIKAPISPVEAYYLIEKYNAVVEPCEHHSSFRPEGLILPTLGARGPCEFLKDGRCSIYADRPMICRVYGHPLGPLACKHACIVKRPITLQTLAGYFRELARVLDPAIKLLGYSQQDLRDGMDAFEEQVSQMTVLVESEEDAAL